MNRQRLFSSILFLALVSFFSCTREPIITKQTTDIQQDSLARLRGIDSILKAVGGLSTPDSIPLSQTERAKNKETTSRYLDKKDCPYILRSGFYRRYEHEVASEGVGYSSFFDNSLPEDVIWPGNILLASTAQSDFPQDLPGLNRYRKPGRISLAVVNGQGGMADVLTFSKSEVYDKINKIIATNSNGLPADIRFQANVIRSEAEAAYYMGITQEQYKNEYKKTFGNVRWKENTLKVLLRLDQTFFSMLFDDPDQGGAGLFDSSLSPEIFGAYTGKGRPLGYISSVSYGRSFTIIFEEKERTYVSGQTLCTKVADFVQNKKTKTHQLVDPLDPDRFENIDRTLEKTTHIYIRQIGGKPLSLSADVFSDPDKLQKLLAESATFGPGNIGKPIAYRLKYLYNLHNVPAVRQIKTSYWYNDYEPEEDNNALCLYSLQLVADPMGNRPTGGNYDYISSNSFFRIHHIRWAYGLSAGSEPQASRIVLQDRNIDGVKGGSIHIPTELRTPPLGVDPKDAWMKLSFLVSVHAERYSNGLFGGRSDGADRTYERHIRFRYEPRLKRWMIDADNAPYSLDRPFAFFGITHNVDYCPVNFRLRYQLSTPHKKYD